MSMLSPEQHNEIQDLIAKKIHRQPHLTSEQHKEVEDLIDLKIDKQTKFLLEGLEIDFDLAPLTDGFDCNTTGWSAENAVCLLRAAVLAYRKNIDLRLDHITGGNKKDSFVFENTETNTQGFAVSKGNSTIVAFRGTETQVMSNQINDLLTDAKLLLTPFDIGRVHFGFLEGFQSAWENEGLGEFLLKKLEDPHHKIWFSGHSLGAALATLGAARIAFDEKLGPERIGGLYTIGQPRTGDKQFARAFDERMGHRTVRIVKNNDPVTMIPLGIFQGGGIFKLGYKHIGGRRYITRKGTYRHPISEWGIISDRLLGVGYFVFTTGIKLLLSATLKFEFNYDSVVADHDKDNYLASLKDVRDRKRMKKQKKGEDS